MLHAVLARLDASPAQERAIIGEVDELQERVRGAKSGLRDARGDLAAALRGPVLDDAALGAVLGRVDAATGEARAAVIDALRDIHGAARRQAARAGRATCSTAAVAGGGGVWPLPLT